MTPTVSVIIPNYNYARYLPERIESVLKQTYRDFEVIILDDLSTDNSLEVIRRYQDMDERIVDVVVSSENSGSPFVQWEKGLSRARGKYAWIAEADDVADPDFLRYMVAAMEADSDVAVARAMSRLIDSNGGPHPMKSLEEDAADGCTYIYDGTEYLRCRMLQWNRCYNASMMLFSMDAWRALKSKSYMKLRYVGDWQFWGELMFGHKIADVRRQLSSFRLHGSSVTDGSKKTPRLNAESEIISYRFRKMLPELSPGMHIVHRYLIYRKYIRDHTHDYEREFRNIDSEFWKSEGVSRLSYPLLWLYKHTFWLIEKRMVKTRQASLKPLAVIR